MRTITESEGFYGYLIGLQVEPSMPFCVGRELYALFDYRGETCVWRVPDYELFSLLARHLREIAYHRATTDEHGYNKLCISKANGQWRVELP